MEKVVGIMGGAISGNKGSEAMVTSVIRALQKRIGTLRFVIFTPYIKSDRTFADRYRNTELVDGGPAALVFTMFPCSLLEYILRPLRIPVTSLFRETRALKRCDVLVDVAGISFSDGREIFLPFNVLTIWPKIILGGDVVKASQACGPFKHRLNRIFARWLLPRCRYLAARGRSTVENLQSIGVTEFCECPDVAFLLDESEEAASSSASIEHYLDFGTVSRRLVGICPSSVVYKNCLSYGVDYISISAGFVTYLIDQGYRVVLLPHSIRPGTDKLRNNDLPVIGKILQQAGETAEAKAVGDNLDSTALRAIIGRCDFFLASRFHSMISALATCVPVMVCGWGHKYFETLDMFGLRDYAFDYHQLSLEMLKTVFSKLVQNEQMVRDKIKTNLPGVIEQAGVQIDKIVDLLQNKNIT